MSKISRLLILSCIFYLPLNDVYGNTSFTTGAYENNQHLVDTLSIPSAKALVINVTGVTEGYYDFLTLYDERGNRIARLSGAIYENFLIPGNVVLVEFISDSGYTMPGVTVNISESSILPPRWQTFQFDHPFFGVTHDPQRQRFYIVQGNDLVLELMEDTLAVVATHPIAGAVHLTSIVYLNNALWLGDTSDSHLVYKLDLLTNTVQSFAISAFPRGLGTDGTALYVINDENSGILNVVDPATGKIIDIITTTIHNPIGITTLPNGGDLLVLDSSQDVYQVEKATGNARYFLTIPADYDLPEDITYLQAYGVDMMVVSYGNNGRISFGLFSDETIDLGISESYDFVYENYYVVESQGTVYLDLFRSGFDTASPAAVPVQFTDITAIGGAPPLVYPADFENTPQMGYFSEGSATGTFQVVLNDDQIDEENESLMLTLLDAFGQPKTAILHIIDNDTAGILILPTSIVTTTENTATFAVTLSTQPSAEVDVHFNHEFSDNHTVLTFNPTNWNVPQTVTIAGIRDDFKWSEINSNYWFDKKPFSFTFPSVTAHNLVPKMVITKISQYPSYYQSKLPPIPSTTFWDVATAPTLQINTTDPHYSRMFQADRLNFQQESVVDSEATFTGIISLNEHDWVGGVNLTSDGAGGMYVGNMLIGSDFIPHSVTVTMNIQPAQADLGKKADLLFIIGVELEPPYNQGIDTTYFSIGLGYLENQLNLLAPPEVWVAQLTKSLEDPFIRDVTLENVLSVRSQFEFKPQSYSDLRTLGYYFFMAYRLEDGTIVYNKQPLTIIYQ